MNQTGVAIESVTEPVTAMSLARRFKSDLKRKLIELGNIHTFRDWFIASYWDELATEELTVEKIGAAITYLETSPE